MVGYHFLTTLFLLAAAEVQEILALLVPAVLVVEVLLIHLIEQVRQAIPHQPLQVRVITEAPHQIQLHP
jgi:hypothetical protein